MKYLLNSAVITGPGVYQYEYIDKQNALVWAAGTFVSAIGYEQTALALQLIIGVEVPVNRKIVNMEPGDQALVFRLVFPPGTDRIDPKNKGKLEDQILQGNYELGLLTRLS